MKKIINYFNFLIWLLNKSSYFFLKLYWIGSKKLIKSSYKKNICFFISIPWFYDSVLEFLLYKYYKFKNIKVNYYIDDGNYPINELNNSFDKLSRKNEIKKIKKINLIGRIFLKMSNIKYEKLKYKENPSIKNIKYIKDLRNFKHAEVNVGSHAIESTFKYFKRCTLNEKDLNIAKLYLGIACSNLDNFIKLQKQNKFTEVFMSHGVYSSWGPIADYCKLKNIKFISYGRAKKNSTYSFCLNKPAPELDMESAWERFKDKKLNDLQRKKILQILGSRETHNEDIFQYNFSKRTNSKDELLKIKKNLGLDFNKKIICFYSNLIWDASSTSRSFLFSDFQECIEETIQYFSSNNNVQFLLRPHPAEIVIGSHEKYVDLLEKYIRKKILFVGDVNINSFDIINLTDVDIVNTSTIGIEAAISGKPVFVVANTHFKNKGFTIDCKNKDEFFNKLSLSIDKEIINKEETKENALKYFYLMMEKQQIEVPIEYKNNVFYEYKFNDFKEIINTKFTKVLDHIIKPDAQDSIID